MTTSLSQKFGRPVDVVGAEHDVYVSGPLLDEIAVLLGQTTTHRHLDVGPFGLQSL